MTQHERKAGEECNTWNYRVIFANGGYSIREVYYDKNGTPIACTEEPCEPWGKTPDELQSDLEFMRQALDGPIINISYFEVFTGRRQNHV